MDFCAHRARPAQPMQVAAPAGIILNRSRLLNMLSQPPFRMNWDSHRLPIGRTRQKKVIQVTGVSIFWLFAEEKIHAEAIHAHSALLARISIECGTQCFPRSRFRDMESTEASIEEILLLKSLSAVSEAPTSRELGVEALWRALQIQRLEGSRPRGTMGFVCG